MMWLLLKKPKVFYVKVSDDVFEEVQRFRYKVYCEELNFLDKDNYPDGKESDEYDPFSAHILVMLGKKIVGYTRVVLPNEKGLPIFNDFQAPRPNNSSASCEISRFIIDKTYRHKDKIRREIFRLLASEIATIAYNNGIKNVYAVVEEWLLKSMNKRGYNFVKIAEGKEFMGATTYPVMLTLDQKDKLL